MNKLNHILFSLVSLLTFSLVGCSKDQGSYVKKAYLLEDDADGLAPLYGINSTTRKTPKANYIVVLNDQIDWENVAFESEKLEKTLSSKKNKLFRHAIKGFSIQLNADDLLQIRKDPHVKYVELDKAMKVSYTQFSAPWGLDRIDQQTIPLSGSYTYETTGSSVDAYIFDTGIRFDHNDFKDRIKSWYNAMSPDSIPEDENGHGTHVAGIVGGTRYGVAKGINLIPVKVLDAFGTGSFSQIIAGIDWAIANHTTRPAVGNVSISGELSVSLDEAIKRAIADGIVIAVAAGNNAEPARNASPGRVNEAITVGAVNNNDDWSAFSNFGPEVDILAPGSNIISAWHTGINDVNTISGTSMATPHVTGAAALFLEKFPRSTPAQVQSGLKEFSAINRIKNVPDSTVNSLLNIYFKVLTAPVEPVLVSPANGTLSLPPKVTFEWNSVEFALSYDLQYAEKADFSTQILTVLDLKTTTYVSADFAYGKVYYWRIRAKGEKGISNWSNAYTFKTQDLGYTKPQYTILRPDPIIHGDEQLFKAMRISPAGKTHTKQ